MRDQPQAVILNVDDDAVGRCVTSQALREVGFEVVEAETGEDALLLVRAQPDLVILDVNLPGIDGFEVCQRLKADPGTASIPVLHLTANSRTSEDKVHGLDSGADGYLIEPVEPPELIATVKALLRVRRAEEAARSAARQWQAMLDAIGDGVCLLDREGRVSRCNRALTRILSRPVGDIVGRTFQELPGPTPGGTPASPFNRLRETDRRQTEEVALGDYWFRVATDPVRDERGGLTGAICILSDITDRKRAEEWLSRISKAVESTSDAIGITDLSGRSVYHNQAFAKCYGYTPEDLNALGGPRAMFADTTLAEQVSATIQDGRTWSGEVELSSKCGQVLATLLRADCILDDSGKRIGLIGVYTDITEKKKLEAQFLRAQRMESIGTLAGGIAHDLNNVLTPILMAIELLEEFVPAHARQTLLEPLQTSALRGAEMVKQVLSFARGVEGQRTHLQLKHVIRDIENMLQHALPKSIELRASMPTSLATVSGDATQLYQVLMNLCVNARDAMPQGGRLTISAENVSLDEHYALMNPEARPGPYVLLTVADTGTGIPPQVLEKIFDPFFTTKEHGQGTGLGLSTTLGIVKSHAGFITVSSEVGKGTRFAVYLPALATGEAKQTGETSKLLPVGRGECILVVDDEASVREITKATLAAHGYRVLSARDGAEAVALYAQHRGEIRAVLTDTAMPVMDGPATVRALQRINARVPVIAVSGQAGSEKAGGFPDLGVQAHLQKPYTADMLLTTLRRILDEGADPDGEAARAASDGMYERPDGECSAAYAEVM